MNLQEIQSEESVGNFNKHTNSADTAEKMSPQEKLYTVKDHLWHTSRGETANILMNCTTEKMPSSGEDGRSNET